MRLQKDVQLVSLVTDGHGNITEYGVKFGPSSIIGFITDIDPNTGMGTPLDSSRQVVEPAWGGEIADTYSKEYCIMLVLRAKLEEML
jgi:hypothetical protein